MNFDTFSCMITNIVQLEEFLKIRINPFNNSTAFKNSFPGFRSTSLCCVFSLYTLSGKCPRELKGNQCTPWVLCILWFHIWHQNCHNDRSAPENSSGQSVYQSQWIHLHFAYCKQSQIVVPFDALVRILAHN